MQTGCRCNAGGCRLEQLQQPPPHSLPHGGSPFLTNLRRASEVLEDRPWQRIGRASRPPCTASTNPRPRCTSRADLLAPTAPESPSSTAPPASPGRRWPTSSAPPDTAPAPATFSTAGHGLPLTRHDGLASSTQAAGPRHRRGGALRVPVHRRAPGMAPGRAGNTRSDHRAPPRRPLMGEGGRSAPLTPLPGAARGAVAKLRYQAGA